jgi:hypothetical protein
MAAATGWGVGGITAGNQKFSVKNSSELSPPNAKRSSQRTLRRQRIRNKSTRSIALQNPNQIPSSIQFEPVPNRAPAAANPPAHPTPTNNHRKANSFMPHYSAFREKRTRLFVHLPLPNECNPHTAQPNVKSRLHPDATKVPVVCCLGIPKVPETLPELWRYAIPAGLLRFF